MKTLDYFRKPHLSIIMASIFLFVSCEQYENQVIETQAFDYSIFHEYQKSSVPNKVRIDIQNSNVKNLNLKKAEKNEVVLGIINVNTEGTFELPNEVLMLLEVESSEILPKALEKNILNQTEVDLTNIFLNDLKQSGFENAIQNYEKTVLKLSLNKEEFAKANAFANIMKSLHYDNPDFFGDGISSRDLDSWWTCVVAVAGLTVATLALLECLTVFACILAIILWDAALKSVAEECGTAPADPVFT
jgi:hypothetical protein